MNLPLPLAYLDIPAIMALMIPIVALLIPIVGLLVKHQQQMAQIVHGAHSSGVSREEVDALRREVRELKEIVNQQTIAVDSLQGRPSGQPPSVPQRLTEVQS